MKSGISHIEINVSDYSKSILFYDLILQNIGWKKLVCRTDHTTYTDGLSKIVLCPTDLKYIKNGYHRKNTGLNHLALNAHSKNDVDLFYKNVLQKNSIPCLYEGIPTAEEDYYSVFFEDPDRLKLEVVYSEKYCNESHWLNNLENNFDPYKK